MKPEYTDRPIKTANESYSLNAEMGVLNLYVGRMYARKPHHPVASFFPSGFSRKHSFLNAAICVAVGFFGVVVSKWMIQNTLSRQAVFTFYHFFFSVVFLRFVDFLFKLRYESRQHYRYDSAYLMLHSVIYSFTGCVSHWNHPFILRARVSHRVPVPQHWKLCNVLNSCVPFCARFSSFSLFLNFIYCATYTQPPPTTTTADASHTHTLTITECSFFPSSF